jgi:hypothetical protein
MNDEWGDLIEPTPKDHALAGGIILLIIIFVVGFFLGHLMH